MDSFLLKFPLMGVPPLILLAFVLLDGEVFFPDTLVPV